MSDAKQLMISRHVSERIDPDTSTVSTEYVYTFLFDGRDFGSKTVDGETYKLFLRKLSQLEKMFGESHDAKDVAGKLIELGTQLSRLFLSEELRDRLFSLPDLTFISIQTQDHSTPWEILYESQFAGHKFCIGRNAPYHSRCERTKPTGGLHALLIGNPTGDLEFAGEEIREISQKLNEAVNNITKTYALTAEITMLEGHNASKERVLLEALLGTTQLDLLHFAGHARPDQGRDGQSGLILADGILKAYEVEQMRVSPLIFANACYSGGVRGRSPLSGYYAISGLGPSFLKGGAIGFVGSIWPVADRVGKAVATEFYAEVLGGVSIGEALTVAKKRTFVKYGDFSVFGYILFGDPEQKLSLFEPQVTSGSYINDIGFDRVFEIEHEFSRLELLVANDLPWILWQENDFVDWVGRIIVSEDRRARMLKTLFNYRDTFRKLVLS